MNTDTRSSSRRLLLVLLGGALLLVAGLTLARLSAYGIWDPWELSVADAARKLSDGTFKGGPITVPLRLVSASFSAFGAREWAGRLPMALSGLALLGVTYAWVSALANRRAGVYAALVLASTPFFLLHSREMVGATPAFLGSALVMMGASSALFGREQRGPRVALLLGLAALGGLWGAYSAGVLSTVAPPLLSVSALVLLTGHYKHAQGAQRIAGWVVLCATAVVSLLVLRAVLRHAADFSVWLGGVPLDGALVTYERPIEHLFHGFAPWSAVLPVALACLLRLRSAPADARAGADGASRFGLGLLCVLWASLAYGAQSILLSSFGPQAYIAPGALAVAAALWLREREEREESDLGELIVIVLLLGLIIRDFAMYPGSPFGALEIGEAKAPDVFNPKRIWSLLLGLFGGLLVLTSMAGGSRGALDLLAPYRGIKKLWRKSGGHRSWLVVFAATLLGLLVFGVLAFAAPRAMHITSLGARIGRALMFVPLALPLAVAGGQLLHHVSVRLDKLRSIPLLAGALLVGAYTSQVFLPKLSAHLSPRVVFDSYNALAKADEPLAQHRIEGRAAAYYAKGEVREIAAQSELVDFLASGGRKWAVLPSDQLSEIDVGFRRKTGRHLFVPSLDNAKIMLVASQSVAGKQDQNPLTRYVKKQIPAVEHQVNADMDGKIELVGYNLELPRKGTVGPGQSFHITWVWRAKQSNLGAYQVFLHLDADNQRINGDHDPVDGKYPVRLWDEGDVILDRQEISIPATSPAGLYTLYVGMYRGESRLKVTEGPHDPVDRIRAGTIRVQ